MYFHALITAYYLPNKLFFSNSARLWKSDYNAKVTKGTVSPDFGIYTGPVTVLDIGDSHCIEFWPDNNSVRLFGPESIHHVEKAIDSGMEFFHLIKA